MLTSKRGLTAATFFVTTALIAAPAMASDNPTQPQAAPAEAPLLEELAITSDAPVAVTTSIKATPFQADLSDLEIAKLEADTLAIARASAGIDLGTESLAGDDEASSDLEISGNVAMVSDYRFRGVSFSDGDIALQGGVDVAHSSGFYVGTWGSSISGGTAFGELELDIYGGWSGEVSDGVSFDVGLLYYIYPTGDVAGAATDYFEPYASISYDLGPVSTTVGVAYAWEQTSLGDQDNLYLYTDFEMGIADTPLSASVHLGYTDGVFATDLGGNSFDWGVGLSYAVTDSLSLGVNYVDTEGPSIEDFTDTGFFFTLGYSM